MLAHNIKAYNILVKGAKELNQMLNDDQEFDPTFRFVGFVDGEGYTTANNTWDTTDLKTAAKNYLSRDDFPNSDLEWNREDMEWNREDMEDKNFPMIVALSTTDMDAIERAVEIVEDAAGKSENSPNLGFHLVASIYDDEGCAHLIILGSVNVNGFHMETTKNLI